MLHRFLILFSFILAAIPVLAQDINVADFYLDGKLMGKTPMLLDSILACDHNLEVKLDKHATLHENLEVKRNETFAVTGTLATGRPVTINADISNAVVYIDGKEMGSVPYDGSLTFGSHGIYAMAEGKRFGEQQVNVTEGTSALAYTLDSETEAGRKYVDLGLSVKWATMNVGASSPEDYGDYFAWGETTGYNNGKEYFGWSNYKWCKGSFDKLTKYCTKRKYGKVDNKTALELADDAAHVNWGGSWRMPTEAEQDELRKKCNWSWTSLNGKNGYKVIGPNGNSIFLPAAGLRYNSDLYYAGSCGDYWSSTLDPYLDGYAYGLYFDSDYWHWHHYDRYYGRSVRAVCP